MCLKSHTSKGSFWNEEFESQKQSNFKLGIMKVSRKGGCTKEKLSSCLVLVSFPTLLGQKKDDYLKHRVGKGGDVTLEIILGWTYSTIL